MSIGVGGYSELEALGELGDMTDEVQPIQIEEYQARIGKAQALMKQQGVSVVFLNAGTNLNYFTGTEWSASDRLVGALLPAEGEVEYIVPHFEVDTLKQFAQIPAPMNAWHEDESPQQLVIDRLAELKVESGDFAIDESLAFFSFDGFRKCSSQFNFVNAKSITAE